MRVAVRTVLSQIAARFSDDAPTVNEAVLLRRYSALPAWPADAELSLGLLAWALGSGFSIRGFREAVNLLVPDFDAAAEVIDLWPHIALECICRTGMRNASTVVKWNLDPEIIYWPMHLPSYLGARV